MRTEAEPNTDEMIDLLLGLVPYTKVSHHEPGRITLQLSLSGLAKIQDNNYDGLVDKIPGILDTRTNLWTRSVDIDYDLEVLPHDLWESLLGLKDAPEGSEQVRSRLKTVLDRYLP
jgi:hypothetical protein